MYVITTDIGPCKGRTIRRTDSRTFASCIAKEHEVVVLPEAHVTKGGVSYVPNHAYRRRPFHLRAKLSGPQSAETINAPQKIHLRDFWSSTFCSVGGCVGSKSMSWGSRCRSLTDQTATLFVPLFDHTRACSRFYHGTEECPRSLSFVVCSIWR